MLKLISPKNKQVFQRNNNNLAIITIELETDSSNACIITAVPLKNGTGFALTSTPKNGKISEQITLQSGYYQLETEQNGENVKITIGVGEVFLIIGHSFSEDYGSNSADDERIIMPNNLFHPMQNPSLYEQTEFISMKDFSLQTVQTFQYEYQVENNIKQGIWGKLGNQLVQKFDCPILFLNGGFGGSNLEHWYKALYNIPFEHPFIDYSVRMPAIKAKNMLQKIVPKTGIRAVICLHGDNDNSHPDTNLIFGYYQSIIQKLRELSGISTLPFVINLSITNYENRKGIIEGATKAIAKIPHCTKGAELYKFTDELRGEDKLHLNQAGQAETARQLAEIIGAKEFLIKNEPYTHNVYKQSNESLIDKFFSNTTVKTSLILIFIFLLFKKIWKF